MLWQPPEISEDEDAVTDAILERLQDKIDGWEPVEGALDVALAEEIGRETAYTNAIALDVIEQAVAGVGVSVFNLPARPATAATLTVRITVTAPGDVIPEGLLVLGTNSSGTEVAFSLPSAITASTTTLNAVFRAVVEGTESNDVSGELTVITATSTVLSATAVGTSAGGTEDETLQQYLTRLVDHLAVLRPGGVTAQDIAALARSVDGVHRVKVYERLDPVTGDARAERTATLYPIDAAGLPVSAEVKADLQDTLQASREIGFRFFVRDPTYTNVHIAAGIELDPGVDAADAEARVTAALTAFLSPATWDTAPDDPRSVADRGGLIGLFDVASVIGAVPGVASIANVTLSPTNPGSTNVILLGRFGLPAPVGPDGSTIALTVD